MSVYLGRTILTHYEQIRFAGDVSHILDINLSRLGVDILKKIYIDHPEYFYQRENLTSGSTEYNVEFAVISRDEYAYLEHEIYMFRNKKRN
jgi:hypothetical protein